MKEFPAYQIYFMTLIAILPVYFFFKYPFSLGGSIAICLIILVLIALLFHLKELSLVFVMTTVVLIGILIINFLSYLENTRTITVPYIVMFSFCTYLIISFFPWLFTWPYKYNVPLREPELKLRKRIRIILLLSPLILGLVSSSVFINLMILFIADVDKDLYNSAHYLRGFYISFAGIVFCYFISYVYISKIGDEDIRGLISEEKLNLIKYDARTFKIWYLLVFCFFTIIGSGIEGERNMWPIWIETVLLVGIMSMILWKIYKHVFRTVGIESGQKE